MTGISHPVGQQAIHPMPFGTTVFRNGTERGTRFRLWAPTARDIRLVLSDQEPLAMERRPDGWYELAVAGAGPGTRYAFRVNDELDVPDPASRFQPDDVHQSSLVVDPCTFAWQDKDWRGRPWGETVLYELHVGTFTPEGTFQGVKRKLDYLLDLGVTAIELMPVADFPGKRNWGYDGVLLYAPDSAYGTPDDLKDLIQTAHQKGLMVFLDVVYNHFGPEGNYLHCYAQSFFNPDHRTPWGDAINFDGPDNRTVRDFFIHSALYWLEEYRFDGLRFDAVHAIRDDSPVHILDEIAEAVRRGPGRDRHIHLVLENDDNAARFLKPGKYDAQWNDDIHHTFHVLASGETSGYYGDYAEATSARHPLEHLGRCLSEGFAYQGELSRYQDRRRGEPSRHLQATAFVAFMQNHDQVGNRAFGDRLGRFADVETLKALYAVLLLSPQIPLLFMGEEWNAGTPFQFFCNFGPDLGPLVTEGRRKEFARFSEFSDPALRERIPDPCRAETYENSKLDWQELLASDHAEWLNDIRKLLCLRQERIVPLLPLLKAGEAFYRSRSHQDLQVVWPLETGQRLELWLFGPGAADGPEDAEDADVIYRRAPGIAGDAPAWNVLWRLRDSFEGRQ